MKRIFRDVKIFSLLSSTFLHQTSAPSNGYFHRRLHWDFPSLSHKYFPLAWPVFPLPRKNRLCARTRCASAIILEINSFFALLFSSRFFQHNIDIGVCCTYYFILSHAEYILFFASLSLYVFCMISVMLLYTYIYRTFARSRGRLMFFFLLTLCKKIQ